MDNKKPKYYLDVAIFDKEFKSDKEYKYRISNGKIDILNENLSDREKGIARYYKTRILFSMDKDGEADYFSRLKPKLEQNNFKTIDCNSRLDGGIMINGVFY